jgi:hypothetical protein
MGGLKNIAVAGDDEKDLTEIRNRLQTSQTDFAQAKQNFMQELTYTYMREQRRNGAGAPPGGESSTCFNDIDDISEAFAMVDLNKQQDVLACLRKIYSLIGGDECDTEGRGKDEYLLPILFLSFLFFFSFFLFFFSFLSFTV